MIFIKVPALSLLLLLYFAVTALAAEDDKKRSQDVDVFSFGDEEEEEKEIRTNFECYDLTADAERTVCLDESLYLLDQKLQAVYREQVSLAPGKDTFFLVREFNQWMAARGSLCQRENGCYARIYKLKLAEMLNSPKVAEMSFRPGGDNYGAVAVSFFGRREDAGYYIDRIGFRTLLKGKSVVTNLYMLDFLDERYWELLMLKPKLNLIDANFDGFDDVVLFLGDQGREGKKVAYLIFDPEKASFYAEPILNNLHVSAFNELHKLVHVEWQQEDNIFGIDFYGYNSRGKLKRVYRHRYVRFTDKDGSSKIKRIIYRSVGGRNAKIASDVIEPDQVGEMPDIMFRKSLPDESNN